MDYMDQSWLASSDTSDFHYTATKTFVYIYICAYLNIRFETGVSTSCNTEADCQTKKEINFISYKVLSVCIFNKVQHNVYGLSNVHISDPVYFHLMPDSL